MTAADAVQSAAAAEAVRWPKPWRAEPGCLIIGAQKAGTTSLFAYLAQHPLVREPRTKELHFFDWNWGKGPGWYARRFPRRAAVPAGGLTLDATPAYLFDPHAPPRAAALLPDAALIVLLRDPVRRAHSHYQHTVRHRGESRSFTQALDDEFASVDARWARYVEDASAFDRELFHLTYAARGRYAEQLERWLARFPTDRLRVYLAEELFAAPAAVTADVQEFLGLPAHDIDDPRARNTGGSYEPIPADVRQRLVEHFGPWNHRLGELLASRGIRPDLRWPDDGCWPEPSARFGGPAA